MDKRYSDFMYEISSDALFEGLLAHGMFAEKLPPVLSSQNFFEYCVAAKPSFENVDRKYVYFESIRNTNIPRQFGIPTPMSYYQLCKCLKDNWPGLQTYFKEKSLNQLHKVSKTHIRSLANSKRIFEMNYSKKELGDEPNIDLVLGNQYVVKADIATFFPSIYTHSLPWALIGKDTAKVERHWSKWFNRIDKCAQRTKHGETHGILIGPHASNLLSEIILCAIDMNLVTNGWKYVRAIDDFTCYVPTVEKAKEFLSDLSEQLHYFGLLLNYKKTEIVELPEPFIDAWVRQIRLLIVNWGQRVLNYETVSSFLDNVMNLSKQNTDNSSIFYYALKALGRRKIEVDAANYCVKIYLHLALLYPYLVPLLETYLFNVFNVDADTIASFSQLLYTQSMKSKYYEGVYYSIYYASKWGFELTGLTADNVINTGNCLVKLFALRYFERLVDVDSIAELTLHAESLVGDDFDGSWLFAYELLPADKLDGDWQGLKNAGVSFL